MTAPDAPARPPCGHCGEPVKGQARINGTRYCVTPDPHTSCYAQVMWKKRLTRHPPGQHP